MGGNLGENRLTKSEFAAEIGRVVRHLYELGDMVRDPNSVAHPLSADEVAEIGETIRNTADNLVETAALLAERVGLKD